MLNQDIRWLHRFQNYLKALGQFTVRLGGS
jgi:hypothetical protein